MLGRQSIGIKTPLIRDGDDLLKIIPDCIFRSITLEDGDIVGITESILARSQGNYVTLDEIVEDIHRLNPKNKPIRLWNPIYSRNRFSMILKAIARSTYEIEIVMPEIDEVGNVLRNHPFTGLNYDEYYREICESEHCKTTIVPKVSYNTINDFFNINCELRPYDSNYKANYITLKDICSDRSQYGLLGSNKSTEEKIKLFPNITKAQQFVSELQQVFKNRGYNVEVMIFADGCFKDPVGGIWEFADPITSPAYTSGLVGKPNELKLKAFIDEGYSDEEISNLIKSKEDLFSQMASQGTTPRRKIDLLASLMDLTSGSGDAGTPIVVVKNYNTTW